ncbi:MAG: WYL domain-containing protein [Nocardioidaceae bacterium]|nr:MAG: WYL domain-containing protein [Nocardioidaceae bacterium]
MPAALPVRRHGPCRSPADGAHHRGRWYLLAHEERSDQVKTFVVSRMSGVSPDEPGTAQVDPVVRHRGLHPLSWQVDSPIEVVLETPVEFRDDVVNWLATPLGRISSSATAPSSYI